LQQAVHLTATLNTAGTHPSRLLLLLLLLLLLCAAAQ
jgi:hypothetical protein